jgi:hypothetical protein
MRRVAITVLLFLLAAACSSGPAERPLATAHNEGVVVEHQLDEWESARQTAVAQCANFGKQPRLRQILTQPSGRQLAVFDCLP